MGVVRRSTRREASGTVRLQIELCGCVIEFGRFYKPGV